VPILLLVAALGMAALLAGWGATSDGDGERIAVVATTPYVADFVGEVGGDAVEVEQLLEPNRDPHRYVPRPSDAEAIAGAELVFVSGRGIDSWAEELVLDSGGEARIVDLGAMGPILLPGGGHVHGGGPRKPGSSEVEYGGHGHSHGPAESDPHWWHDPRNVEAAVPGVENALVVADPSRKSEFIANADAYVGELRALDAGITRCIGSMPAAQRKMITDDNAIAYFANRYRIDVIGTAIPARMNQGQAAKELSELLKTIEAENVRAVFPRRSLGAGVVEAIARQTGASTAYSLYDHTLGPEGSEGDTYLRMEEANADAVVRGLSGGRRGCDVTR
jgi:ABC-type Zn uptake system ZnuABC Zn-binding protein ZnuA